MPSEAWFRAGRTAVALTLPIRAYIGINPVRTDSFRVVVEPDEGGCHAYCPVLRRFGAVTQGSTATEALKNINEVVQMIMDELKEDGIAVPGIAGLLLLVTAPIRPSFGRRSAA